MTPDAVERIVGNTPHTSPQHGRQIYDFVLRNKPTRCLELGFAHGVASTWIAAALDELDDDGMLIAVDNQSAIERQPSAPQLLKAAGLEHRVEFVFEPHSYTWHLMRNMERYVENPFSFVFLDGAHTWDTDGFAFLLVEPMISVGGWVLFDDLNWTFERSPTLKDSDLVRRMPSEMRSTAQVRLIWEKLVLSHPRFTDFRETGDWGWARKGASSDLRDFNYVRTKGRAAVQKAGMIGKARSLVRAARRAIS